MRISRENHIFAMDCSAKPAARVKLPARLTFETLDCFAGQVKSETDTIEKIDFERVNPATGPVYFEGVKAGDVLKVHISEIRTNSPGIMVAAPDAGLLGKLVNEAQTSILDFNETEIEISGVKLPVVPMIGVIGVAPAGDPVACGTPGSHGGNMDNTLISTSSTLYLPVQVEGGLLAMGDLHAAMGDGEIMVSGVEVAGEVDVTVEIAHDMTLKNPLVVTSNVIATIASGDNLDLALEQATMDMAAILQEHAGLSLNDAGMLMSACGNAGICQAVDPQKTARMSISRNIMKKLGLGIAF